MTVGIVGAGSWGTTLAGIAAHHDEVVLWAREPEIVEAVNRDHDNPLFLAGVTLPGRVRATSVLEEALDVDVVVSAVPSKHVRQVWSQAGPHVRADRPLVSLTKGIERHSLLRMTQVLGEVLPDHDVSRIGVLAGPNIATEIAAGQPAATVVAMPDLEVAAQVQRAFMTPRFRVYTNPDVVGCEMGGPVKNVIAIAAGIGDGLGLGDSPKAALITRGLAELTRLGVACGGSPLSFLGLAGNGDLVVTCMSSRSRNHFVGHALGRGRSLDEVLDSMSMVAEGVASAPAVLELASRHQVSMPICEMVGKVLAGQLSAEDAVTELMDRDPVTELHDLG
jgi:glycerol-3-phosphate dehydrogenase (NAD(P)+)